MISIGTTKASARLKWLCTIWKHLHNLRGDKFMNNKLLLNSCEEIGKLINNSKKISFRKKVARIT